MGRPTIYHWLQRYRRAVTLTGMRWNLAGLTSLLALVAIESQTAPPADACGIKLIVKTSTPRKAIARSTNPSHLLLLGTPPHRLERELAAAGHDVEVAKQPTSAKRKQYAVVVVTDGSQAETARTAFPGAVVIVRSGDVANDIASVEGQVARKPVRTGNDDARRVLAARQQRKPIRVGGGTGATAPRVVVSAKDPEPTPTPGQPAVTPTPTPTPPTPTPTPPTPTPTPTQPKDVVATNPTRPPVDEVKPRPTAPVKVAAFRGEIYFNLNSTTPMSTATVTKAAKWLADNPDLQVTVEGHADPSGNADANMTLSQNRAESVKEALVAAGVDASRLEVTGFGATKVKYGAADPRNRRVAITPKK